MVRLYGAVACRKSLRHWTWGWSWMTFFLGKNILPSPSATPEIIAINGAHKIIGELVQDTDENYAAQRIDDSIILIELNEPITHESNFVKLIATKILLYPTNT